MKDAKIAVKNTDIAVKDTEIGYKESPFDVAFLHVLKEWDGKRGVLMRENAF